MSDHRPVATDALVTIGTAPIPKGSGRDAIHLAVEPVVAGETLMAGDKITIDFRDRSAFRWEEGSVLHGIVDPFLSRPVKPDESFWCVLMPRTINSLRHVWSHSDFPEENAPQPPPPIRWVDAHVEAAKDWMVEFATRHGMTYTAVMEGADRFQTSLYREDGEVEYLTTGLSSSIQIEYGFWENYEIIRGVAVPTEARGEFFTCSC